jgi:hypothetical protein
MFLSREFGEWVDVGSAGCKPCRHHAAPVFSDWVTVGSTDFSQQAVGSEQSPPVGHLCRTPAFILGRAPTWKEERSQVSVAQAGQGELAAIHGLQQRTILRRPDCNRTNYAQATKNIPCFGSPLLPS